MKISRVLLLLQAAQHLYGEDIEVELKVSSDDGDHTGGVESVSIFDSLERCNRVAWVELVANG